MKKFSLIIPLMFLCASYLTLNAQTLNQILDLHFDAVKQDKFNKVETIIIKSKITDGKLRGVMTVYHKRNGKLRIERTLGDKSLVTIYGGTGGWKILPDSSKPVPVTGKALEELEFRADLDGYFFCWREKGHKLQLIDEEKLEGKPVYKILCKKDNGDEADLFIDAKNYLLVRSVQRLKENGKTNTVETNISGFKRVEGIQFPFKYEITTGNNTEVQNVQSIKLNTELPDSLFTVKKKT